MSTRFRQVPTVELIGKEGARRLYEIETDTIRIGRDPLSEIAFPDDLFVSWKHAKIKRQHDGTFMLIDLESQNKTTLDGQSLRPNRPLPLRDGSRIGIAQKHELVFHYQAVGMPDEPSGSTVVNAVEDLSSSNLALRSTQPKRMLEAVLEVNRALGGVADLNEMLGKALDGLMRLFPVAERGFILTVEPGDALSARAVRRARSVDRPLTVSQTMLRRVLEEGKAIIIDTTQDPRYKEGDSVRGSGIGVALCAPLTGHSGQAVGIVQLDSPDVIRGFQTSDLELLAGLAIPLGVAVENHGLLKEQVSLAAARQIADALLPEERPKVPGYSYWEYYRPALTVGGDFYDYIPVGPLEQNGNASRWVVMVGDVAGKGFPAALLAAGTSPEIRHFVRSGLGLVDVLERVNNRLSSDRFDCRFVTMALAEIDPDSHRLTVALAGHEEPRLRRRDGSIERIGGSCASTPLGTIAGALYEAELVALEPGDIVVIVTDGVTDARNQAGELFGLNRLLEVLSEAPGTVQGVGTALSAAVRTHAGGGPQFDDITILCFGRDPL
jgi:hypothetical protein